MKKKPDENNYYITLGKITYTIIGYGVVLFLALVFVTIVSISMVTDGPHCQTLGTIESIQSYNGNYLVATVNGKQITTEWYPKTPLPEVGQTIEKCMRTYGWIIKSESNLVSAVQR